MLKGNNRLVFNQATMMEIVDFYLRNKMLNKDELGAVVNGVETDRDGMFVISIGEPDPKVAAPAFPPDWNASGDPPSGGTSGGRLR